MKAILSQIVIGVILAVTVIGCSLCGKNSDYKYTIIDDTGHIYNTNTYNKTTESCIVFYDKGDKTTKVEVCGSKRIQTNPNYKKKK